jgi:hypothetical protein
VKVTVLLGKVIVDGTVTVAVKVTVCVATLTGEEDAIVIVGVAWPTGSVEVVVLAAKLASPL